MASKTSTEQTKRRGRRSKAEIERERKARHSRQIAAIIFFVLGILFFALSIYAGESVWRACHDFLFGMFGVTGYLIAPVFIYIAVCSAMDRPFGAIRHKIWQTAVLFILVSSLLQVILVGDVPGSNFIDQCIRLYETGVAKQGGGLVSALVGWPLLAACGRVGAGIIIGLLIFVFLMLLTGATLLGFFRGVSKPVKKMREEYEERAELREQERIEKSENSSRFDIDVDLGPAPKPGDKGASFKLLPFERPKKTSGRRSSIDIPLDDTPPTPFHAEPEAASAAEKAQPVTLRPEEAAKEVRKVEAEIAAGEETEKPGYVFPPVSLLNAPRGRSNVDVSAELNANANRLVETLKSFGVQTTVVNVSRGPAVTRYELQPSAGVKISRITGLADDIALNLAAAGVRIEAPIPNKPAVGIEVPNRNVDVVTVREIIDCGRFNTAKSRLSVALGRDLAGNETLVDIAKMPHLLIAGATGSGKSVCINSIIISLLYKAKPDEVKLLMIDPKVVELGVYNGIPHLLVPVVTDPRKAAGALGWAVSEMLKRYKLFADNSVRDLDGYNSIAANTEDLEVLPQIVIIIDELADLMMAAPKEVEDAICRLAQMARAAGMHLIIATQRPSVDVITGLIKANIPSRIAFAVASQVDSRTILDSAGADKLLGRGDMLYYPVGYPKPVRVQGCFVSEKEVEKVVSFVKRKDTAEYDESVIEEIEKQAAAEKGSGSGDGGGFDEQDEVLSAAIECVIEAGQASTSYLQRRLRLGYARAARLVDEMEEMGIVGPYEGSKPRQVLITRQQWLERGLNRDSEE